MEERVLKIHPKDNVLVALKDLHAGEEVHFENAVYKIRSDVPAKHKFCTERKKEGDLLLMYGVVIGKAIQPIEVGEPISRENVIHEIEEVNRQDASYSWTPPNVDKWRSRTFLGYHREDGKVGTRNYWIVTSLVFCENRNLKAVEESLLRQLGYADKKSQAIDIQPLVSALSDGADVNTIEEIELSRVGTSTAHQTFPNVDGIKFLPHQMGCGGTRKDARELCELIAGYIANPNVAGATVLSLGCQNAEQRLLEEAIVERDPKQSKPVYILEQQQSRSEEQFVAEAVKSTFIGLMEANKTSRSTAPLSKLVVGLECGGSDGFSGISANPALGHSSDMINALEGASMLAEFPELNGIEQDIVKRCENETISDRFIQLMSDYSKKAELVGSGFDANPSPGNIKDGLITDAMKSAGAARKGGSAPVVAVLDYTEPMQRQGLNLLCTPGNDVESTTALAGSGANLIVFTTGLGTPTGNPVAPVVKMSSNTALFQKMGDIIDIDAGPIIKGVSSIEKVGEELLELLIRVASGEQLTKAELLGQDDFIPWKRDVSL